MALQKKMIHIIEAHNHNWSMINNDLFLLVTTNNNNELWACKVENMKDLREGLGY